MRRVPSFVGTAATENDSNGGDGSATINLRALGAGNTLTIINGRRAFGFENINAIPISALSRTEVLKDGASAVYGADAVAGVVNFILLNGPGEKNYEGAEINLLYGNTTDTDANVRQVYLRGGVASDKFAIAASGEYYSRANLYARDREIAATADVRALGGFNNNSLNYSGHVTVSGVARTLIDQSNNAPRGIIDYRRFDPQGPGSDDDRFNFRVYSPSIPAQEKAMSFVTGKYKVFGNGLQLYADILYAKTKQDNGLAPSPFVIPFGGYINASLGIGSPNRATSLNDQRAIIRISPFNPFPGTTLTQLRYRLINELGNRRSFNDQDYYRYTAGLKGDFVVPGNGLLSTWGYDAGFVYERRDLLRIDSGDANRDGIYREILAGNFNPFIGPQAPVAGTAPTYVRGIPTGNVAPYDNAAAVARSTYLGRTYFYGRDHLYDGKIYANLIPNLYQGGLGINLGYEHRLSATNSVPDPTQAANDQLGFGAGVKEKYKQEADSYFGELIVPIITSAMNIPAVSSLEISGAYRYEEFDNKDQFTASTAHFDNGGTPRLALRYQPFNDLTLRASWGKSFLSPSPGRLFAPVLQQFFTVFDPLTNAFVEPVDGILTGGNIQLRPERTDTYTCGVGWAPKFLPGFTITGDVYQVFTRDLILESFEFQRILLTVNGNSGGTLFPDLVIREPGTRIPLQIIAKTENAAKRLVNGLDITAAYEIRTQNFGIFTISGGYNHFFTWKAEAVTGIGSTSFLGNYNTGSIPLAPGAIPWNKGFLRGEWEWKGLDFVATGNYVGDFDDDPSFIRGNVRTNDSVTNPTFVLSRRVPSYITLDMQLSYEFKKSRIESAAAGYPDAKSLTNGSLEGANHGSVWDRLLAGTTIRVGVVNAFDRNPPTVLGAFNDNYDTSLYSIRNRYYYIGLSRKF